MKIFQKYEEEKKRLQREKCQLLYDKLVQENLMKIIYQFDNVLICNMANGFYCGFGYDVLKGVPIGILIAPDELELALSSENGIYQVLSLYKKDDAHNRVGMFNDIAIEDLRKIKERTDTQGSDLDLEYEERLLNELKSGGRK